MGFNLLLSFCSIELIKEKDSLIREIRKLEKSVLKYDMTDESCMICPSLEVQYQMSLEYLSSLPSRAVSSDYQRSGSYIGSLWSYDHEAAFAV